MAQQHPQHILHRCIQNRRAFFVEEPVYERISSWWFEIEQREFDVWVVVPHLPNWLSNELVTAMHQSLMDELFDQYAIANPILWYCTSSALTFTEHLRASMIVYDHIDEVSPFQVSASKVQELDQALLQRADVVFKGQQTLCEAKHRFLDGICVLNIR